MSELWEVLVQALPGVPLGVPGHRPARGGVVRDRDGGGAVRRRPPGGARPVGPIGSAGCTSSSSATSRCSCCSTSPTWGSAGRDPVGPWVAGTASLGLYTAAYVAETIRSGVFAVGKGQIDAGLSLGFTYRQVLSQIVLPQAVRSVIPPLGSLIIAMIKNSAIIGAVARARRRPAEGGPADQLRDVPVQRGVLLGGRRLPDLDGQRDLRGPGARTTARGQAMSERVS